MIKLSIAEGESVMKKNFVSLLFVFLLTAITVVLITTEPLHHECYTKADETVSRYGNVISGSWDAIDISELLDLIEQSTPCYAGYNNYYAQSDLDHGNITTGRRVEANAHELLELFMNGSVYNVSLINGNTCNLFLMSIVYSIYNGDTVYKYVFD